MKMLSNKYYSSKQENMIADYLGWSVVSGSGSRNTLPGDIQNEDWLGECKTHASSGQIVSFKHKVWKKIKDEAVAKFKYPALFVDDGSQTSENTWVMYRRFTACKFANIELNDITSLVPSPFVPELRRDNEDARKIVRISSDSINFSTDLLMSNRRLLESYIPVIYHAWWRDKDSSPEWVNISTLEDFHYMFVKYGG